MQEGQSATEDTIESWRRIDDKSTRDAHETASAQCNELSDFGNKLRDEIRAADLAVNTLVDKQIKRDVPTGHTPNRVTREFPKSLVSGTPDDIRKKRFREQWNVSGLAAKMDFDSPDNDLLEEEDLDSEASHDDTRDSVVSYLIFWRELAKRRSAIETHLLFLLFLLFLLLFLLIFQILLLPLLFFYSLVSLAMLLSDATERCY